jgi:hypothetical protein
LFENFFGLGTLTVTEEKDGWPKENILDWQIGTANRWGGTTTGSFSQDFTVDLGAGNDLEPDCWAVGGHTAGINFNDPSTAIAIFHSDDDIIYTIHTDTAGPSFPQLETNLPYFGYLPSSVGAHRYWRFRFGSSNWSPAASVGILTLGRILAADRFPLELDTTQVDLNVTRYDSENGEMLGSNLESVQKTFELDFSDAGLGLTDFHEPVSGLGFQDFATHIKSGFPFWFGIIDGTADVQPAYLAQVDQFGIPFVGTDDRRALKTSLRVYRDIA